MGFWEDFLEWVGGPDSDDSVTPPCGRAVVRINRIYINKSESYGVFGEPGSNAEWNMSLGVEGSTKSWSESVKDDSEYPVGLEFYVDLTGPNSQIRVSASGVEEDDSSANDTLPVAEYTHGSFDNWGIGGTHTISNSNSDFSYMVYYQIDCLYTRTSALSVENAMTAVQSRLESRDVDTSNLSEDELLTMFVNTMELHEFELHSVSDGMMFWEGPTLIQEEVERTFATDRE